MNEPSQAERDDAIRLLARAIPRETLANVLMLVRNKQTPWQLASHFGLGLQVRNALRETGFKWSDAYLDEHWHELVEQAARIATNASIN